MVKANRVIIPYLYKRGKNYYFRYQLSRAEFDLIGLREIKLSLKTNQLQKASFLALSLSGCLERVFRMASKKTSLTKQETKEWLKEYLKAELDGFREVVAKAHIDSSFDPEFQKEMWQKDEALLVRNIENHQYRKRTVWLAERLCRETESEMPIPGTVEFDDLCRTVSFADLQRARAAVECYSLPLEEYESLQLYSAATDQLDQKPEQTSELLSAVVKAYKDEYWSGNNTKKTCEEIDVKIGYFLEWVEEDLPITAVTKDHIREYRKALLKLPANHAVHPKLKKLSFKDKILQGVGFPALKDKTKQKHFGILTSFFIWCENAGYIENSPVGKIKIKKTSKDSIVKLPFDHDDLQAIIEAPLFTGYKTEKIWTAPGKIKKRRPEYWFVLIAMLSGLRIGEIVQLRKCDLKHIEKGGVGWVIDVNDDGDKTVKTPQSVRQVPLHEKLVNLDFPAWVQKVGGGKKGFIFYGLLPGGKGEPSKKASPKFNRFLKKLGLHSKQKTFHSFRHSFKDALKTAKVVPYDIDSLMGHDSDKGSVKYGVGSELESLRVAIDSVGKKLNFSKLF